MAIFPLPAIQCMQGDADLKDALSALPQDLYGSSNLSSVCAYTQVPFPDRLVTWAIPHL